MSLSDASIEMVPGTSLRGLRVASFQRSCVDFHWHFHPEIELTWIEEGRGVHHIGDSIQPYSAGDFYVLGSHVPHAYGSHPDDRCGARWTVLHFLPSVWGDEFWKLPETRRIAKFLEDIKRGVKIPARHSGLWKSLLTKLVNTPPGAAQLARLILVLEKLSQAKEAQYLNPHPVAMGELRKIDPRIQSLLVWLGDTASSQDLTQAGAARHLQMSPQAFCRFFRTATGRPFHRYINEWRIARVCAELENSAKSVAEIAFSAGFGNLANFNRRFLETTGTTPGRYRKASLSTEEGGGP